MQFNVLYNVDCIEGLKKLPDKSINLVVTSPPYFGLRAYDDVHPTIWGGKPGCNHEWVSYIRSGITGGPNTKNLRKYARQTSQLVPKTEYSICSKCNAWFGVLGLEEMPERYVNNLSSIFDEVYRVLTDDGALFLNIGDSYLGSGKGATPNPGNQIENFVFPKKPIEILGGWRKPKQLALIPFRVAIELQNRNWLLRNTIIWRKPNALPNSVKDRFIVDFEPIFFFTKSRKYYFKQILEPFSNRSKLDEVYKGKSIKNYEVEKAQNPSDTKRRIIESMQRRGGRSKRAVWDICTQPLRYNHTASFPEKLIEVPILCACPEDGVVMDIFAGTFTTGLVAHRLGRKYIGFEMSNRYCEIAKARFEDSLKVPLEIQSSVI